MAWSKPIPQEVQEKLIIDWRTGEYTIRHLASKWKISVGKTSELVKGIDKDLVNMVNAGSIYKQGIAKSDERVVNAVDKAIDYKLRVANLANTFVEKSIIKATQMLETVQDAQSIKALSDAVDKNTITAGVNERHAKPTQIQNNTQNIDVILNKEQAFRASRELVINGHLSDSD